MRYSFFFIFLFICFSVQAQTSDEKDIQAVVDQLFKGMEKGDSAMVHNAFTKEVSMTTIFRDKTNNPVIINENSLTEFLNAVGKPHKEVWYEEIWNMKINVDGDFASAWCDYAFYVDKNFSHCGVDAFHLFRTKEGWKIFHLADTRRKANCTIPADIEKKHK
jgi:hypothetical protein